MKKKYFIAAMALVALASCSSDDFIGENINSPNSGKASDAIMFNSGAKGITRSTHVGSDAANMLNKQFVVEGIKYINNSPVEVFDNYVVVFDENSANKTTSNTANWEYVGYGPLTGKADVKEQSIKYWDYSASQYDFWAYSLGTGSATVSTLAHDATLASEAYTFTGSAEDLSQVYISNLVSAYNPTETGQPAFQDQVNLTFRSLVAKVRVGLYETIPGYSVRNVNFYIASGAKGEFATLYTASGSEIPTSGVCTVYFPEIGKSNIKKTVNETEVNNPNYNLAHVKFGGSGASTEQNPSFGKLSYGPGETGKYEKSGNASNKWLARTTAQPTWATETGKEPGEYSIVLPNEEGTVLTLKIDYTLESTDGSGEAITVYGATALVPAQYTQWKSNYAYTYIFKISNNTNGTTALLGDVAGLYPITFDAVVIDSEEDTQETITTVATPSITTYSLTSKVTENNEYTVSDDIYVTATTDGSLMSMTDKATLYKISKTGFTFASDNPFTEAEVLEALNKYTSLTSGTYVGRNDITLAPIAGALDLSLTKIPLVDNNEITGLTAGQVALIDKSKLEANNYYAFVYETTAPGTPTEKNEYTVVSPTPAVGADVSNYYIYNSATSTYVQATGTAIAGVSYFTQNPTYYIANGKYAIKVIRVVAAS